MTLPPPFTTDPTDRRERFLVLQRVYDLHLAPLDHVGDAARLQGDPRVAALKARLEAEWLEELEETSTERLAGYGGLADLEAVRDALTDLAVRDRLPAAYHWLAKVADRAQTLRFLALEGGPDGGFDDLVAVCQVGLDGPAKGELARNYWDEMGDGDPEQVHTTLHRRLGQALDLPRLEPEDLPVEALERAALTGLLATNRWLQPELVGALGMTELQAGPRCRMVVQALERVGAPEAALPFYRVHAEVDPRHGRDWVDNAVVPLVAQRPEWGPRIVRGAVWRTVTNLRFFASVQAALSTLEAA